MYQTAFLIDKYCECTLVMTDLMDSMINGNLTQQNLTDNLTKNIFVITGTINDFIEMLTSETGPQTYEDTVLVYNQFNTIGQRLGKIFRIIYSFTATRLEPPKPLKPLNPNGPLRALEAAPTHVHSHRKH